MMCADLLHTLQQANGNFTCAFEQSSSHHKKHELEWIENLHMDLKKHTHSTSHTRAQFHLFLVSSIAYSAAVHSGGCSRVSVGIIFLVPQILGYLRFYVYLLKTSCHSL